MFLLNIAIVDDEATERAQLLAIIAQYAKENSAVIQASEYKNGDEFLEKAQPSSLDVVFLDIYMSGRSGMEVAYELKRQHHSCRIVFVTTSAAFAVQSYEVRAFYYLLKPYTYRDIADILQMLDQTSKKDSRFLEVKEGRDWRKILLSDILYVDYNNHYLQIHTEISIVSTYMKFPEMEEKLLCYPEFLSCYRCIMVNMNKIKKMDDLFFLLSNGEYIPMNRKRVKEIKKMYTDYIFGVMEEGSDHDQ